MTNEQVKSEEQRIGKQVATANFAKGQNKADLSRLSKANAQTVEHVIKGQGCQLKSLIQVVDAAGLVLELKNKEE